jgi:hypothetical protein
VDVSARLCCGKRPRLQRQQQQRSARRPGSQRHGCTDRHADHGCTDRNADRTLAGVATSTPTPGGPVSYVLENSTILGPGMAVPEPLTGTFDDTDNNPHCCNVAVELAYSNIDWRSASYSITGSGSSDATTFTLQVVTEFTLDPGASVTLRGQQPLAGHFLGGRIIRDVTVTGEGYTITLSAQPG